MSLEENKAIVRKWVEATNKRNLSVLDELIAPNFFHPTWQLRGAEGFKQFYTMFLRGFPDCRARAASSTKVPKLTLSWEGIVPEFPSSLFLPLFMIATLLAVTVHKRKCA